jgi:hypothetical protein
MLAVVNAASADRQSPLGLFAGQPRPRRYRVVEGLRTRHYATLAIASVAALMLSACASSDRDAVFDHPPDSTYVVSTSKLEHEDTLAEVQAAQVTAEFFAVIDRPPWLGRTFLAQDFGVQAQPVVVLSHKLWKNQLGERHEIIGRTLELDGRKYTVIGVMPPAIEWPPGVDLWVPPISQSL